MLSEISSQLAYMQRLRRAFGMIPALNIRTRMFASGLGLPTAPAVELHPDVLDKPVQLRLHTTDIDIYEQVLIKEEYGALNDLNPRLVVDCGANVGYSSAYFLSRFPKASVVAVEPFPSNADLCRRNLQPYGERAEVRQAAIWSSDTSLVLDNVHSSHEWAVTVRRARDDEDAAVEGVSIPSLTGGEIDLLKVDIEGSEIELFGDTAESWLPRVRNIAVELHGGPCRDAFFARMSGYSYDLGEAGELTICRDIRPRGG